MFAYMVEIYIVRHCGKHIYKMHTEQNEAGKTSALNNEKTVEYREKICQAKMRQKFFGKKLNIKCQRYQKVSP